MDSSVWIDLVPFRPDTFVTLWSLIEQLACEGRLIAPEEVDREIYPSADHPAGWLHDRPYMQRSTESLWSRACEVADRHPQLVSFAKPKGAADPFVVAAAIEEDLIREGTLFPCAAVVVTNERSHLPGRVALPDACAGYGIAVADMYALFRLENWRF